MAWHLRTCTLQRITGLKRKEPVYENKYRRKGKYMFIGNVSTY